MNLIEILKNVPKGTKFYSSDFGEVSLAYIHNVYDEDIIALKTLDGDVIEYFEDGVRTHSIRKPNECTITRYKNAECTLFPSKENRDWATFNIDYPIDTPMMVSDSGVSWVFRYYAGNNHCWTDSKKSPENMRKMAWNYCIPFSEFDCNNPEKHLKK